MGVFGYKGPNWLRSVNLENLLRTVESDCPGSNARNALYPAPEFHRAPHGQEV
jgi:hypothetical protein